jgi:predicted DCC family thiol-disulfide oxidoreductase YuxK
MFAIPAIWHSSDMRPVVLFDGKCNLCNAGVQLVLDYDRASTDPRGNLRVAALQSRVGKILLARLPKRQRDKVLSVSDKDKEYKSIVVTTPTKTYLNSAACIRIGRELRGPLRCLALLAWIIPPFIRDPLYKIMSRYRKRLFGESPECRLWDDNWDTRFVDDALFGGKGSNEMDPFADPSFKADEKEEEDDSDDDGDVETALPPNVGDTVRVISSKPIIHTHVAGYEEGLCSVGLVGTVTRVLEQRAYPKSVAVKFQTENDKGREFEAHFYPGQVRKE